MGTDLRIVQRITKIARERGGTVVNDPGDTGLLGLIIKLRHAGALGEADLKRLRSVKRKPDTHGLRQIFAALEWGESVDMLGVIRMDDHCMLYVKPFESIVEASNEPPAAQAVDTSMFKSMSNYEDACDPSIFKHLKGPQYRHLTMMD